MRTHFRFRRLTAALVSAVLVSVAIAGCDRIAKPVTVEDRAAAAAAEAAGPQALTAEARKGNPAAQYLLGRAFSSDYGAPGWGTDNAQAAYWYRQAAEHDLADAQVLLGLAFSDGKGIQQDDREAFQWFTRAAVHPPASFADTSLGLAQYQVGNAYAAGRGVEQDQAEAAAWFRRSANQGAAPAQYFVGVAYQNGDGVPQNDTLAFDWYRRAAGQGYPDAEYNLGLAYADGRGVQADLGEATQWFRRAAEQGNTLAQYNLALCYAQGWGVQEDPVESMKWFEIAARLGDDEAGAAINRVSSALTPEQLVEAQARATEWVAAFEPNQP